MNGDRMQKKKFLIVAHNIRFLVQFVMNDMKILQDMGYEVHCAVNYKDDHVIDGAFQTLERAGIIIHQIDCARSPLHILQNGKALRQLVKLIKQEGYAGLHCHTPIGGVLGRIGGKLGGVEKILYTGHGFHFYKGSSLASWLLYFPVEWICSFMTDVIITINHEDYNFALQHMHAGKAVCIPGVGVDLNRFCPAEDRRHEIRQRIRRELGIPQDAVMLLSVGEVNDNKNHRVIMEALKRLNRKDIFYVICGKGPLEESHKSYCRECGLTNRVIFAGFQDEIEDFYRAADMNLFPSKREGLGLAAVEGMACGTPLIASDTRGSREYCIDGKNSLVCSWQSADEFTSAISRLLLDDKYAKNIATQGVQMARKFGLNIANGIMQKVYQDALHF